MRIHDDAGVLLAYCSLALKKENIILSFPKGFDPTANIFNLHRCEGSSVNIKRNPLDVFKAYENGTKSAIFFLTNSISSMQLLAFANTMQQLNIHSFLIT